MICYNIVYHIRLSSLCDSVTYTPSPPAKSFDFEGFDSSELLILKVGILMSVEFYRESPGSFDSRTLNRTTLSRWTGHITGRGAEAAPGRRAAVGQVARGPGQ